MKTTQGHIHDAGVALAMIFNKPRVIPQTAKYKLARVHKSLSAVSDAIEKQRYELVKELGEETKDENGKSLGWTVPESKMDAYRERWDAIHGSPIYESFLGGPADARSASPSGNRYP